MELTNNRIQKLNRRITNRDTILKYRLYMGLTQKEVSTLLGIKMYNYVNMEYGKSSFTDEHLLAMRQSFDQWKQESIEYYKFKLQELESL